MVRVVLNGENSVAALLSHTSEVFIMSFKTISSCIHITRSWHFINGNHFLYIAGQFPSFDSRTHLFNLNWSNSPYKTQRTLGATLVELQHFILLTAGGNLKDFSGILYYSELIVTCSVVYMTPKQCSTYVSIRPHNMMIEIAINILKTLTEMDHVL